MSLRIFGLALAAACAAFAQQNAPQKQQKAAPPNTTAPPQIKVSQVVKGLGLMKVEATDASGRTYVPSGPVTLNVKISGASQEDHTVTISPAQPVATFVVPVSGSGAAQVTGSDPQNRFTASNATFDFSQPKPAASVSNVTIKLHTSPESPIPVGSRARLVAALLGDDQQPASLSADLDITFPDLDDGMLNPAHLKIPKDAGYGACDLTSTAPRALTLQPYASPTRIAGTQIQAPSIDVQFVAPPAGMHFHVAQPSMISSLLQNPSTTINVLLVASDDTPVNSDGVREVFLSLNPPGGGRLSDSIVTIPFGQSQSPTPITYTPLQSGVTQLIGSAGGLRSAEADLNFDYPWWGGKLMWVVLVGGFIGALLRATEQATIQKRKVNLRDCMWFGVSGLAGGFLAFLFGSTLLKTDFQQALLGSGSSSLVALYWGLFGGYLGPLVIMGKLVPTKA